MNAVRRVDLQARLTLRLRGLGLYYLKDAGRTVALGGLRPGGQVDRHRDALVLQLEVAGLILVVAGVGQVHRRELVKAEPPVRLGVVDGLAAAGQAQLAIVRLLVQQGKRRGAGEQPLLQPVEGAAKPGTEAVQRRAEVAGGLQLLRQPALLQRVLILGQIPAPLIAAAQAHGDRAGRQHAGLHGGVNALDA